MALQKVAFELPQRAVGARSFQHRSIPRSEPCGACGGAGWCYGADYALVRCLSCVNFLASSRLTPEEQALTVSSLGDRADDVNREVMAMRFLAKQMLADPYGSLSICGACGDGKSLLLAALVADFCRAGREARYYSADEIAAALMPNTNAEGAQDFEGKSPEQVKAMLKRLPVLAIDEMDKIDWSAWLVRHIGEIIDYRHRSPEAMVTLFAMNRPPAEWGTKAGASVDAIESRLRDGRFNRPWPVHLLDKLPGCLRTFEDDGEHFAPGFFTTTLADLRPSLKRTR